LTVLRVLDILKVNNSKSQEKLMKANVGSVDKVVRYVAGIVIIALGFYFKSWWGAVGLIPLLTAVMGWCPLYALFKISTKKAQ
jgi:predicted RND superfamily exporter protein